LHEALFFYTVVVVLPKAASQSALINNCFTPPIVERTYMDDKKVVSGSDKSKALAAA
jgi:hypothetical protein